VNVKKKRVDFKTVILLYIKIPNPDGC